MSKPHSPARKPPAAQFDCSKCPGYCCSYPRIEVTDEDLQRLARHFGISSDQAQERYTRWYRSDEGRERILKHQKDTVYKTICGFFDTEARRCTIYRARPQVCRDYPNGRRCGYYFFLQFERGHQEDPDFIPSA